VLHAEPFVGGSLGYSFSGNLSSITANENTGYEGAPSGIYAPGGDPDPWSLLYPGAHYSDVKLKDTLSGGLKAGYYFDSYPALGFEVEGNYSQPNIKAQNVTITHPGFVNLLVSESDVLGQDHFTENQLGAKVKMFQFNLNALYRYQGFKDFTPYIGAGPSLNVLRITGSGISGNFSAPDSLVGAPLAEGPNIHQTSVNVGANFKAGVSYHLDDKWGLGMEYHYNWTPIEVDAFRSAQNLKADYESHNLSVVLEKHF
jgi:opacity protein-like surface antigen